MLCNICTHATDAFGVARIMDKYDIRYYQCTYCGFVQTETPFWLDEAYATVINASDIGLVGRNIKQAQLTYSVIVSLFKSSGKFVDFGGGYGLFVRLMRDKGIRFYRYDPLCENLFANSFDAAPPGEERYDLVTAFELFEHLVKPLDEIQKMLQFAPGIFFSTHLLPPDRPILENWWYYGLDHGQHVSIYSRKSLDIIGERFGLRLYSNDHAYHLLMDKHISPKRFRLAVNTKIANVVNLLVRYPSLIPEDYFFITGRNLS